MRYEYGIWNKTEDVLHREGMSQTEAYEWMDPAEWDGGDPSKIFEVVYRVVGDWQKSQLVDWVEPDKERGGS